MSGYLHDRPLIKICWPVLTEGIPIKVAEVGVGTLPGQAVYVEHVADMKHIDRACTMHADDTSHINHGRESWRAVGRGT